MLQVRLQHYCWALYQIAEQVGCEFAVLDKGFESIYPTVFKVAQIVTFYIIHHLAFVSEVKLKLPCAQHVF